MTVANISTTVFDFFIFFDDEGVVVVDEMEEMDVFVVVIAGSPSLPVPVLILLKSASIPDDDDDLLLLFSFSCFSSFCTTLSFSFSLLLALPLLMTVVALFARRRTSCFVVMDPPPITRWFEAPVLFTACFGRILEVFAGLPSGHPAIARLSRLLFTAIPATKQVAPLGVTFCHETPR